MNPSSHVVPHLCVPFPGAVSPYPDGRVALKHHARPQRGVHVQHLCAAAYARGVGTAPIATCYMCEECARGRHRTEQKALRRLVQGIGGTGHKATHMGGNGMGLATRYLATREG